MFSVAGIVGHCRTHASINRKRRNVFLPCPAGAQATAIAAEFNCNLGAAKADLLACLLRRYRRWPPLFITSSSAMRIWSRQRCRIARRTGDPTLSSNRISMLLPSGRPQVTASPTRTTPDQTIPCPILALFLTLGSELSAHQSLASD